MERLAKVRNQDPLADGVERYVSLEHLEPGELRIGCIRISVQSSQLPLHRRLAALAELFQLAFRPLPNCSCRSDGCFPESSNGGTWPVADRRHPAPTDRFLFKAVGQARIAPPKAERPLSRCPVVR